MRVVLRIFFAVWLLVSAGLVIAEAATPVTPGLSRLQNGIEISIGFFGGIKNRNTFKLLLSEQGGLRYYRISPTFMLSYKNQQTNISNLPLNMPVKVTTDHGLVTGVTILGAGQ